MSSTSTASIEPADEAPVATGARAPTSSSQRFWTVLLLIAIAGLGLRVAYVLGAKRGEPMMGDAIYYNGQAVALAEGRGFTCPFPGTPSCPKKVPVADHPPLTALAMAPASWLFPKDDTAQRLSMTLIGTAGIVVIGMLGRSLAGERAGLIAAAIAAVYPNLWVNDGLIMSETLAALTVALALLLAYRVARRPSWTSVVALGAVCGLAILTRAELGLLIPAVAIPVVFVARGLATRRRVELAAVIVLSAVVVIAPWVVPNMFRTTHGAITTTALSTITAASSTRRRVARPRATNTTGIATAGIRRPSSARVRIASPHTAPSATTLVQDGRRATRYASMRASATVSAASVSDMMSPSLTQRFGYTAAIAAAISPSRSPANDRPSMPITTIPAVPMSVIDRRCAVSSFGNSHDAGAIASAVSGG